MSKEDFALHVVDRYLAEVHALLDQALGDTDRAPLERVRLFFERLMALYASQGYLGSFIGLLGQELAAVNTAFRRRMEGAFDGIARRLAEPLEEARRRGDLPAEADPLQAANLMLDCWEGAAARSRLLRSAARSRRRSRCRSGPFWPDCGRRATGGGRRATGGGNGLTTQGSHKSFGARGCRAGGMRSGTANDRLDVQ